MPDTDDFLGEESPSPIKPATLITSQELEKMNDIANGALNVIEKTKAKPKAATPAKPKAATPAKPKAATPAKPKAATPAKPKGNGTLAALKANLKGKDVSEPAKPAKAAAKPANGEARLRAKSDGKYREAVQAAFEKLKATRPGFEATTRELAEKHELPTWAFKAAGHKLEKEGKAKVKNKDRVNTIVRI